MICFLKFFRFLVDDEKKFLILEEYEGNFKINACCELTDIESITEEDKNLKLNLRNAHQVNNKILSILKNNIKGKRIYRVDHSI